MSNGHPRNRAFFVWYSGDYGKAPNGLNILDLDDPAYPIHSVKLPAQRALDKLFSDAALD